MNWGDGAECLRNSLHAPETQRWGGGLAVEAYATDGELWCAASNESPCDPSTMCMILCHSIRWESKFMPTFVATKRAVDLQLEVSNNLLNDGFCLSDPKHFPAWPIFGSILKKTNQSARKVVTFATELQPPYDDDPLSSPKAVLISGRQARLLHTEESTAQGLHPEHAMPHEGQDGWNFPQPPGFVQDLFALFDAQGLPLATLQAEGFLIRTWFRHHQHFPRWRVPRFIELDHNWFNWQPEIERAWRDMIDQRRAVWLSVVHPDPYRHYVTRNVVADIIVAQEEESGLFAGLLTVDQQRQDTSRAFAIALSLPQLVNKQILTVAADLDTICGTADCRFFFRWTQLNDETEVHQMQNGHGFQAHIFTRNDALTAASSSFVDEVSFMQRRKAKGLRPLTFNDPEAPPWYPHVNDVRGHVARNNQLLQAADESDDSPAEDAGDESGRSEDPIIHPPDDDNARQAVMMFHLDDVPVHAMLDWTDWPSMMREIAYHYAVDREDVLDCHELNVRLPDVPEGIAPVIVQQVQDVPVGTAYVLILVDVEVHGQWMEAHFGVAPIFERKVVAVPSLLSRNVLLSQARVFEFCRFEKMRCLVEFKHVPWYLQDPNPRRAMFGDHAKIILPPSDRCEVSTGELLADSRQLTVEDFWSRYYEPSSPAQSSSGTVDSNVSPSLLDSEDIRAEYGQADDTYDDISVMQRPSSSSSDPLHPTADEHANQTCPADCNNTCVADLLENDLHENPPGIPWPLWFRHFFKNFADLHEVEDVNEGPVAYVRTWYLNCLEEIASEDSRVVRLSQRPLDWLHDIQQRWRDRIDATKPVHMAWVYPKPKDSPFEHTIGHLIVFQQPNPRNVPTLLSFQFLALRDGTGHAAMVLRKDASPEHVVEVAKLSRVCQGRRCTLHRGTHGSSWGLALNTGEGLKLIIPSPGERAHEELHWNRGVTLVFPDMFVADVPVLSFRIEDYPRFVQDLHALWVQQAMMHPASREKTVEITTWYDLPFNDQARNVHLDDDFSSWEQLIRNAWSDLADVDEPFSFVFVNPVPPPSPLDRIHVLAFQQIPADQSGVIITKYDNALLQGAPTSTAAVVPQQVTHEDLLRCAGTALECSLRRSQVQCSTWHIGTEIRDQPFATSHGLGFNVLIHRQALVSWESDEENETEEQNLLQHQGHWADNGETTQSEFVLDLQRTCRQQGKEPTALKLATWFLAPGQEIFSCLQPRLIELPSDTTQWEQWIHDAWNDTAVRHLPIVCSLVHPSPVLMEGTVDAHVLVVQQPTGATIGALVTILDTTTQPRVVRQASLLNAALSYDNVLLAAGLHDVYAQFIIWHDKGSVVARHTSARQGRGCNHSSSLGESVRRRAIQLHHPTTFTAVESACSSKPTDPYRGKGAQAPKD